MEKTKALLVNLSYRHKKIGDLIRSNQQGNIDTDTLVSSAILCLMSENEEDDDDDDDQLKIDMMTW